MLQIACAALAATVAYAQPSHTTLAYFTAWGIYGRNYQPTDIRGDQITHINYAFANIAGGQCVLGDSYADIEKSYPGDTWDQPLKGNFNQINNVLKKKWPHLKTLISVGGWTWSKDFSDVALTAASRTKFATSCVQFMDKYGFDGIDIDWEYPVFGGLPTNTYRKEDGDNYVLLMQALRAELNKLGGKKLLTVAGSAGYDKLVNYRLKAMGDTIDWFNVMTYDYNGCFSNVSAHLTPIYRNPKDPVEGDLRYNVNESIKIYVDAGVPRSKLLVGFAFYGRGVAQVAGPGSDAATPYLFQKWGKCPQGTWDDWQSGMTGTYDYSDIDAKLKSGWKRYYDNAAQAVYIVSSDSTFISYDDTQTIAAKCNFIKSNNLGGAFLWPIDGDHKAGGVLLTALANGMK